MRTSHFHYSINIPWFLGIIGGIGPEADEMMQQHLRNAMVVRGAGRDQDHIPTVVLKNTRTPDRTAAILHGGESPVPQLLQSLNVLHQLRVPYAIMPCNTAHYFLPHMQREAMHTQIIDMLHITAQYIGQLVQGKTLLLATNGTVQSKIYDKYLQAQHIDYLTPDKALQEQVHQAIYSNRGLKAGNKTDSAQLLQHVITQVRQQHHNLKYVILGCTELPLVQHALQKHFDLMFIDPMVCIANHVADLYVASR